MPKLNLGTLKNNEDFRDWYQYSLKLEESIKYLRQKIDQLEKHSEGLNKKLKAEFKVREET